MAVFRVRPTGYKFPIGLSFDITGIASANAATNTTGGTQTVSGDNTFHSFTSSGFFVPNFDGDIDILIVAGGGGGQSSIPDAGGQGGGGAGGVIIKSGHPVTASSNTIVAIGAGGTAGVRGANSSFATDLIGWGGGGLLNTSPTSPTAGGSSAGQYGGANTGILQTNNPSIPADSRTYGYGNHGGAAAGPPGFGGGGGGGAGGAGNAGIPTGSGVGGIGFLETSIPWLSTPFFGPTSNRFAAGGGGASRAGSGVGGTGGGGPSNHDGVGTSGTANRGSGGGGGGSGGGSGGSGMVIVRYQTTQNVVSRGFFIN